MMAAQDRPPQRLSPPLGTERWREIKLLIWNQGLMCYKKQAGFGIWVAF